ncbi:MAG: hypothetical protein GY847_38240 [Proteobacteria bacterium]|nr:hypothetical protein [Pseudomonadota bacterium]
MHLTSIGLGVLFFLITGVAWGQRPVLEGAASAGSGASFGSGDGETTVLLSPIFMDVDIIYYNDEMPKIEYVIGFQAELQGRVSAGIIPQLRLTNGPREWMVYGLIGAPLVFAPFVMFGVEAGGGLLWKFHPRYGAFAEIVLDLFIIGNDLPDDGILAQLDANIGFRMTF